MVARDVIVGSGPTTGTEHPLWALRRICFHCTYGGAPIADAFLEHFDGTEKYNPVGVKTGTPHDGYVGLVLPVTRQRGLKAIDFHPIVDNCEEPFART